ncbi:MAG: hypothetical protein RL748_295 [Pseudomonadota bacterium]
MFVQDQPGVVQKALKTGHAQGMTEGKAEAMGMDDDAIVAATGLSKQQWHPQVAGSVAATSSAQGHGLALPCRILPAIKHIQ